MGEMKERHSRAIEKLKTDKKMTVTTLEREL